MFSVPGAVARSCGALLLQWTRTQGAAASVNMCLKSRKDVANYHGGERHSVGKNKRNYNAGCAFCRALTLSSVHTHLFACLSTISSTWTKTNRYLNPVCAKSNKLIVKKRGENLLISQPSEKRKCLNVQKVSTQCWRNQEWSPRKTCRLRRRNGVCAHLCTRLWQWRWIAMQNAVVSQYAKAPQGTVGNNYLA